jgi:hypothetical protein
MNADSRKSAAAKVELLVLLLSDQRSSAFVLRQKKSSDKVQ